MKNNQKSVYIAAFILLLGGAGFLIFSGLSQNSVYFLNVSEALAMDPGQLNQARLFGEVSKQDIQHDSKAFGVSFLLLDKDSKEKSLRVIYNGVVPDTFKPGVEVIVEGHFDHARGQFDANSLLTKCPSKYEKNKDGKLRPSQNS